MITNFNKFINEAKKIGDLVDPKAEIEKAEKEEEMFNDMLYDIEKEFLKDPLKVVKAFGKSAKDLFSGKFVCEKELEHADESVVKKVYNKLKK